MRTWNATQRKLNYQLIYVNKITSVLIRCHLQWHQSFVLGLGLEDDLPFLRQQYLMAAFLTLTFERSMALMTDWSRPVVFLVRCRNPMHHPLEKKLKNIVTIHRLKLNATIEFSRKLTIFGCLRKNLSHGSMISFVVGVCCEFICTKKHLLSPNVNFNDSNACWALTAKSKNDKNYSKIFD